MIAYGYSLQGKSHVERNTVCQDSNIAVKLKSGHYLGVVADGVGSAPHSDIGSRMAVEMMYSYCDEHVRREMQSAELEDLLRVAYEYTMDQIKQYVRKQRDAIEDYDTTLSSVIYDGSTVVFGHAGDGGIVVRKKNGQIEPVTERQKGADGSSVCPLRAGISSWDFGVCKDEVASVLLVTDGMLDGVIQPVLVNLPSSPMELVKGTFTKKNVYVTACEFFMNPHMVYQNPYVKNQDAYMQHVLEGNLAKIDQEDFLRCMQFGYTKSFGREKSKQLCESLKKFYFTVWAITKVTDDKSVVCLMNEKVKVTPKELSYYQEPNWKWRQECYQALLYGKDMPPAPSDDPLYKPRKTVEKEDRAEKIPPKRIEKTDELIQTPPVLQKRRVPPKKLYKIITVSAAMICLAIGMIAGVNLGRISTEKKQAAVPSESPTIAPSFSPSPKLDETEVEAKEFWNDFEELKIEDESDASIKKLKNQINDMDVFTLIAEMEDFSGTTGTKSASPGAISTQNDKKRLSISSTSPKPGNSSAPSKLKKISEILDNAEKSTQKKEFEQALLWEYCECRKNNRIDNNIRNTLKVLLTDTNREG